MTTDVTFIDSSKTKIKISLFSKLRGMMFADQGVNQVFARKVYKVVFISQLVYMALIRCRASLTKTAEQHPTTTTPGDNGCLPISTNAQHIIASVFPLDLEFRMQTGKQFNSVGYNENFNVPCLWLEKALEISGKKGVSSLAIEAGLISFYITLDKCTAFPCF